MLSRPNELSAPPPPLTALEAVEGKAAAAAYGTRVWASIHLCLWGNLEVELGDLQ